MVAPCDHPHSRFTAKWSQALQQGGAGIEAKETESRRRLPRAVKLYYKQKRRDEEALEEAKERLTSTAEDNVETLSATAWKTDNKKKRKKKWECSCIQLSVDTAARLTLAVNSLLFFIKLAAAVQSGSLAVLSSVIDSGLDLFSGVVIAVSSYLIKNYDRYHYPIGRNRLEPVAIIITAAVMATASLQIVTSAIEDIAGGTINPNINIFSGIIIFLTVLLKGGLYILCRQVKNPSVQALSVDHRNDVVSNIVALIFGLLGTFVYRYLDPIGAILIAFYIIVNWTLVGYEQLKNLVGHTADRRFLSQLTWLATNYDRRIETVDTVRAYTFGVNYLVEVHIQLPPSMALAEAHDIGEGLQQTLESMEEVERAFVHLDFETVHSPNEEHVKPAKTAFPFPK